MTPSLSSLLPATTEHPRPLYRIVVDGRDISSLIDGRLINLTLNDNRGFEVDQLDITLDDSDGALSLPPRGAVIQLALGWQASGLVDKGDYTVDEVEHSGAPDQITIRARSADMRAGLTTQRERSWHDVTLKDIVCTIADECDLEASIADGLAGQAIEHIDQTNETGANLLTRLARQFDAIATVKSGRLLMLPMAGALSASGHAFEPVLIERQVGDRHRFAIADRETYSGVRALYHDVQGAVKGEVTWGKTEDSAERHEPAPPPAAAPTGQYKDVGKTFKSREAAQRAARKAWRTMQGDKAKRAAYVGASAKYDNRNLGVSGEVRYGEGEEAKERGRAKRLADKDAKATAGDEPAVDPALTPSAENVKTLRHVYASKANAQRAARAEWRRLQRGVATFSITLALGRAELFPELPAIVSGFKPQIDSTEWIITKVMHSLSDSGFTTALELEIKATEIADN